LNLEQVLENPPFPHKDDAGEYVIWGLAEEVLRFIRDHIDGSSRTLETGCGLSTVLFALSGASHICITPSEDEIESIKDYCHKQNIPSDQMTFHRDGSERVLPRLECEPLDLVLIDGRHGFPAPFIDFYYTADKLRIGGLLVIDDTWLWTGEMLKQYLLSEPEWKHEADFSKRTSVFRKLAEGSQSKEWCHQNFVVTNSRFKLNDKPVPHIVTAFRYLKRGEFLVLGSKIVKKLLNVGPTT
jgi:predicted O-methyltransferase YrrM